MFGIQNYGDEKARDLAMAIQRRNLTVDESDLTGASQAVNIGLALPTNAFVIGYEVLVNEQAVGQSDLTLTIGGTDADGIMASTDLDALAANVRTCGTAGILPTGFYSAQQLVATFAATNLATLSAGNWTINVLFVVVA